MFEYLKKFIAFLLPIVRNAALEVARDEINKFVDPKPSRYGHNRFERQPWEGFDTGKYDSALFAEQRKNGYHDVLMVAFDLTGPNAGLVQQWLMEQMPSTGDHAHSGGGYIKSTINLDSWWIANDDRVDGSDTDSAVFVAKGNQAEARSLLRLHGLVD